MHKLIKKQIKVKPGQTERASTCPWQSLHIALWQP